MCVPCVLQVSRAFTFKQQCQRSDQSLKSLLGKLPPISDNGEINLEVNSDKQSKIEDANMQIVALGEEIKEHSFQIQSDESGRGNLDTELVLDVLPSEIQTSPFEEEIELSSLPSETEFSPVATENIQKHLATNDILLNNAQETKKENIAQKFGDYFDEIKLDGAQVVSLSDETFGKFILYTHYLNILINVPENKIFPENISADKIDGKKMPTDEFICDILSDDKLKTGHASSTFKCTNCDLLLETEEKLRAHIQYSHTPDAANNANQRGTRDNSLECPECHKVFAGKKILKRHLKIHSPIKPHCCAHPDCGMSFAESSNLSKHMKKHTGELRNVIGKPNLCSVCGKGFKWVSCQQNIRRMRLFELIFSL